MDFKWMPVVDAVRCSGCNLCVESCGPKSLTMAENQVAVLSMPDTCGSEEHCIAACPDDAIFMAWLPFAGNKSVGRWRPATQSKTVQPVATGGKQGSVS